MLLLLNLPPAIALVRAGPHGGAARRRVRVRVRVRRTGRQQGEDMTEGRRGRQQERTLFLRNRILTNECRGFGAGDSRSSATSNRTACLRRIQRRRFVHMFLGPWVAYFYIPPISSQIAPAYHPSCGPSACPTCRAPLSEGKAKKGIAPPPG